MTRVLTVIALLTAVLTPLTGATPSDAATVSVTIYASETRLAEGESTVISGKVTGARAGVVRLQRRATRSWRTVDHQPMGSRGHYSFKVTPPTGKQRYRTRVVSPSGELLGQSFQAILQVAELPYVTTIEAGPRRVETEAGPAVEIIGNVDPVRESGVVRLQELIDGEWVDQQTRALTCTCGFTFQQPLSGPRGPERVVVDADELHLGAVSKLPDLSEVLTYQGQLDGPPVLVDDRVGGRERLISFDGNAGDLIGFAPSNDYSLTGTASILDSGGSEVPSYQLSTDDGVIQYHHQWRLPTDGTYVLRLSGAAQRVEVGEITLHRQVNVSAALDATYDIRVEPGQAAVITVPASYGQELTFAVDGGIAFGYDIQGPDGPIASGKTYDLVKRRTATATGDYVITIPNNEDLLADHYRVAASVPRELSTVPNSGPVEIPPAAWGQVIRVSFDATAGDLIGDTLGGTGWSSVRQTLTDSQGALITATFGGFGGGFWRIPQTGTYTFEYAPTTSSGEHPSSWEVTRAIEADAVVNTGPLELTTTRPNQAFEIWFDAKRDQVVTADFTGSDSPDSVDGAFVGDVNNNGCLGPVCSIRAAETGRYLLWGYVPTPGKVVVDLTMEHLP